MMKIVVFCTKHAGLKLSGELDHVVELPPDTTPHAAFGGASLGPMPDAPGARGPYRGPANPFRYMRA